MSSLVTLDIVFWPGIKTYAYLWEIYKNVKWQVTVPLPGELQAGGLDRNSTVQEVAMLRSLKVTGWNQAPTLARLRPLILFQNFLIIPCIVVARWSFQSLFSHTPSTSFNYLVSLSTKPSRSCPDVQSRDPPHLQGCFAAEFQEGDRAWSPDNRSSANRRHLQHCRYERERFSGGEVCRTVTVILKFNCVHRNCAKMHFFCRFYSSILGCIAVKMVMLLWKVPISNHGQVMWLFMGFSVGLPLVWLWVSTLNGVTTACLPILVISLSSWWKISRHAL